MVGSIYTSWVPVINSRAEPRTSAQLLLSRLLHGAPKIQTSLGHSHKHAAINQMVSRATSDNSNMHNLFSQPFEYLIVFPTFSV